jgi:ABC-type nickel/cobalt efflux system permease component RcnA
MDAWLAQLIEGAPLVVALGLAFLLGLRHASDPDHLVAVTSLVAADDGGVRRAARLGAWWGAGHATTLLVIGLPLIALKGQLPPWLERGAETAVGVVILALGARLLLRRHRPAEHRLRTSRQAFGIGTLHGLAGTGAVVMLLIAVLPGRLEAAGALAVFAPMSIVSMTACTSAFAWVLTRPLVAPLSRTVLVPALGAFALAFGLSYAGVA